MSLTNTTRSYGSIAKGFHWLTALLILTILPLGIIANTLAHEIRNPEIATTDADIARAAFLFSTHKTLGIAVFVVALLRIGWAMTQTKPGLLNADNRPEAMAAETVHWLLYGTLVLVPLTGWIHHAATSGFAPIWWPFGQNLPLVPKNEGLAEFFAGLHWILQWVLIGALILHVAGALKHHVIDRDQTLRRMLPGPNMAPEPPRQHHAKAPPIAAALALVAAIGAGFAAGVFDHHHAPDTQTAALAEVQSDWTVDTGTLGIIVTQLGSPVEGGFAEWTAAITFDEPPAPGPAGKVDVTVAIGSLSLGSVTTDALGKDFFDAETYPTARFVADIFKTDTGYEARGPLTIRDMTADLVLPFALELDGTTATMTGTATLNRLDFGVGQHMPDEGSLAFAVDIQVALTATRN